MDGEVLCHFTKLMPHIGLVQVHLGFPKAKVESTFGCDGYVLLMLPSAYNKHAHFSSPKDRVVSCKLFPLPYMACLLALKKCGWIS